MPESTDDKLNALVGRVGKVRRWLVTLVIMKIAALCLILVSVYIGIYAWLDHQVNFGHRGRVIALILLLAGIAALLYRLTRLLGSHISFSGAANYIENRRSFNQQLVTAMEYHENRQDYPYSRALVEHLVLRVDKDCGGFRFDSTVEKWQGYVLGAIILFGLATALFYIRDNYVYFASYFARLTRPAASVQPLSSTNLRPITEEIVAEPNSDVTFAAEIEGRTPELGRLVLVKLEPDTAKGEVPESDQMQVKPTTGAGQKPRFEASRSFSETGRFQYRFETDTASTKWHELSICPAPEIENITAAVAMPKSPSRNTWVKPYTEQIENNTLEVVEGSTVALNVNATDKLKEVAITAPDGESITKQLNGVKQFTFHFSADTSGSVKFDLINEQGLVNRDLPELEVVVKTDEPPKFKLVCPEGDYLTTDVASVPITFEITDDFGLDSAKMCLEIPGQKPTEVGIVIDEPVKSKQYCHIIELEKYELTVGDSILFHAEATDIDTGSAQANRTASSEVYFIEIRPYRQDWRRRPGGGSSQGGTPPPVELLNILEYTRAILKKTWAIAGKPTLAGSDRSALDSIDNDLRYCAEQLGLIRDDSDYGFNDRQKAVLDIVLQKYEEASKYLTEYNARSAIAPEKDAYRILRKFILELELQWNPPSTSQGQQPQRPDSVKLQERPEFSEYEKERIEAELKKVQQELEKLTAEQKNLKRTFENLLRQQSEQASSAQKSADGSPSTDAGQEQGRNSQGSAKQGEASASREGKPSSGSQGGSREQDPDENPSASNSQNAGEGRSTSGDPKAGNERASADSQSISKGGSTGEGKSAGEGQDAAGASQRQTDENRGGSKGRSPGRDASAQDRSGIDGGSPTETQSDEQGQGGRQSSAANAEARLRMLQARQRALQQQVTQLKRDLEQLPDSADGDQGQGRAEAQKHLDEAVARMDDFQDRLAQARYRADMGRSDSEQTLELMESARRQMDMARKALDGELSLSDEEKLAQEAQKMAEQLAEEADALDESVTPQQEQDMLALLEEAKRLLETMPEPQWTTMDQSKGARSAAGLVLTRGPETAPAEAARQLARQFWSISIDARRRRQRLAEDESSDVKFYGQENEFFENAAKFDPESVQK